MFKKNKSVPRSTNEMVYKTPVTIRDYKSTFITLAVYIYIFLMWAYLSVAYYNFGKYIITTGVAAMLIVSAIVAKILPSQRMECISDMKKGLVSYVTLLFGYRFVIIMMQGVSSEDLSAAFNMSMPAPSGTSMLGWLQNFLWIASILIPIGLVGMQIKKIAQFFGTKKKSQAIREIRDIRDNEKPY